MPSSTVRLNSERLYDYADSSNDGVQPSAEDIAHHLSWQVRFMGATPTPCYVSEHSRFVYREFIRRHPESTGLQRLAALLHDASETVTGDIPGPFKQFLLELKIIEYGIQRRILVSLVRHHLNWDIPDGVIVNLLHSTEVKAVDTYARILEEAIFFGNATGLSDFPEQVICLYPKPKPIWSLPPLSAHTVRSSGFILDFYEAIALCQKQGAQANFCTERSE